MASVTESGADDNRTIAGLQRLGLNLYESRAYRALLLKRQASAKELGHIALIPQSRTYDILESLSKKGFAMTTPSSPRLYSAVPPEKVLPSYYRIRKQEAQSIVTRIQSEAEKKLDELQEAYSNLMKDLPGTARQDLSMPQPVWVVEGREAIESSILSLIRDAKTEHLRITRPPELKSNLPLDPFYIVGVENQRFVEEAVRRGIKMRWLSLSREIPTFLGLEVTEHPERRYFERDEDVPEKFVVADSETVLLNLRDPVSQSFGSVALLMHSEGASSVFREHFETMWAKSKPLDSILGKAEKLVHDVLARMKELGFRKTEIAIFEALSRIGASAEATLREERKVRKMPSSEVSASLTRLLKAGFVHRNGALRLIMVENPSNVIPMLKKGAATA